MSIDVMEVAKAAMHVSAGEHLIDRIEGAAPGPTLVVVGSIHGNEPAGVAAARSIAPEIRALSDRLRGDVVLLAGNTRALAAERRYVDSDLNRHWTPVRMEALESGTLGRDTSEDDELRELWDEFRRARTGARGDLFVIDLHTTSAPGKPFVTLGDTLRNRAFASAFPVTVILGIEEQLEGTMLEILNEQGAVTLGFEAGQHTHPDTFANDVAAIWIALVTAGMLEPEDVRDLAGQRRTLERAGGGLRFVEIRHRHPVRPGDGFQMDPGFVNFQPVRRGDALARDWRGTIRAGETGVILMPLYQPLGDDGFFLAREVKQFWLTLSRWLRRSGAPSLLPFLPGVRRHTQDPNVLFVNTRLARYFPLQVFHLFGFRRQRWADDWLTVTRRPEPSTWTQQSGGPPPEPAGES